MTHVLRQRLLATTLLVGASVVASPAYAQTNPPDTAGTPTIPETTTPMEGQTVVTTSAEGETIRRQSDIVVTGTRIPQPNLTSASPVTVVTAQEVKLQGTSRTEDLINSLPQVFASQGSNISNGSTGTATVDLRGLGTSRTMVLINGRRLHPGDPRFPVADLNFIPTALIRRVDVLTGGASSVYGADAVAGVVNFIMDTNFRGLRIDGQASVFMHNNNGNADILRANDARGFRYPTGTSINGGAVDIAGVFGTGFDDGRGHVTAYATYRRQRSVLQATRDYSYCALAAVSEAQAATLGRRFSCSGSSTSATGTFFQFSPTAPFPLIDVFQVGPGQTFASGSTPFNFNPYNYFQRPQERYTLGAFAEYEISPAARPYLEVMFMDDQTDAVIAPSGNFGATNTINCDNPLLSQQQRDRVCAPDRTFVDAAGVERASVLTLRRNVEGGGRQDDLQHTAFRTVGGIRGDLTRGLDYNAYYMYGRTNLSETYLNDFSKTRLARAMDVVADPVTGQPVCRAVVTGLDPNCVPYNIFVFGGVTQDQLDYLQTPGFQRGMVAQQTASMDLTFSGADYGLIMPWTDRGVGVNVGAQYVKNSLVFRTDTAFETGDLAGQGGPTIGVSGSYDVRELFGEVELPVISESFIHELTVRAGYRYSDYRVARNNFSTNTYKIEGEFAPVRDVRLRGSYNRAVRAPNVVELFSVQSIGLGGTADPCAGPAVNGLVNGLTAAQCARTGVTAGQFGGIVENPANQYNTLFGGNPNLAPEKADSYTLGVVLQPRFVPGLAVTVDYFDIKVRDLIGTIGTDTIIAQCIATGDPFFCNRINRDQFGSLFLTEAGFTEDINTNVGGLRTKGIDLQGSYARQIGRLGSLNLSMVGTWLKDLEINPLGDIVYDCASYYGQQCNTPNPKWRHKARAGFTLPSGIGASVQWRYFSRVDTDASSEDEDLAQAPTSSANFPANRRLSAQSYFDLALQARVTDRVNLRIGANNIFDRDPPVAGQQTVGFPGGNGNTYPQVYDSLGRYLFAGFTVDF